MGKVINLEEYRRKKIIKNMSQITFADINPLYAFIDSIKRSSEQVKDVDDRIKDEIANLPRIEIEEVFSDLKGDINDDEQI